MTEWSVREVFHRKIGPRTPATRSALCFYINLLSPQPDASRCLLFLRCAYWTFALLGIFFCIIKLLMWQDEGQNWCRIFIKKPVEWLGGALIDYDYSIFVYTKCANSVKILKVWLKDALKCVLNFHKLRENTKLEFMNKNQNSLLAIWILYEKFEFLWRQLFFS